MNQRIPRGEVPALDRMRDKFDREDAASMAWRILYCRPGSERKILDALLERRLTGYAPMETVWRGVGQRRHRAARPLIPRYIFALIPDSAIPTVAHLDGVQRMIGDHTGPGAAPEAFMVELMDAEKAGEFNRTGEPRREFKKGDHVRIARGKWQGFVGIFVKATNKRRADLIISVFGRPGPVNIDMETLELEAA